jgi:hypothetical protein
MPYLRFRKAKGVLAGTASKSVFAFCVLDIETTAL